MGTLLGERSLWRTSRNAAIVCIAVVVATLSSCTAPNGIGEYIGYRQGAAIAPKVGSEFVYTYVARGDSAIALHERAVVVASGPLGNGQDSAFTIERESDTVNHFTTSGFEDYDALMSGDLRYGSASCKPYVLGFSSHRSDTVMAVNMPIYANGESWYMSMSGKTEFAGSEPVLFNHTVYNTVKVERKINFTFTPMTAQAVSKNTSSAPSSRILHYTTVRTYYYSSTVGFFLKESEEGYGQWPGTSEPFRHFDRTLVSMDVK